ncbi:MAG: helix-turn-helix transcriptional regulator [Acidobacteria bacterium]|nr:helix-turn-helix transcriptional regulator [Acidobacteriota bacterium]
MQRILVLLNDSMLADGRWHQTSALIDEAIGARGSALTFADEPTEGNVRILFSKCFYRGVDRAAWQRDYFRYYQSDDEHVPRVRVLPDGKIVSVPDLFSEQELKTSRMYNEALVRFAGQNGLRVRLDGPRRSLIVWGIQNPMHGNGWSFAQVDLVRRLLPHLRQYVRVRSALADSEALGTSVAELLDSTRLGVIQLGPEGRILEANDMAAALLRRCDGLYDDKRVLRAATAEENSRLQNLVARALPRLAEFGVSGSMMVSRPSLASRLALHVKPVANRELDYRSRNVTALVLIVDPQSRTAVEPALVQSMLDLTPAESEVVSLLAQGRTLRQIAAMSGREYNTVRTHLHHVSVKLGVSRQFEIAQLALALSDLPSSRDR